MTRDELLTKAAMYTPGWGKIPEECPDSLLGVEWHWERGVKTLRGFGHVIHEPEYLQRRAELINEPSPDSHDWPKIVQTEDGKWFGVNESFRMSVSHEFKGDTLWVSRGEGEYLCEHKSPVWPIAGHDWRDTLKRVERRAKTVSCDCGDGFPADSYGAGFMAASGGVCANCDAARACDPPEAPEWDGETWPPPIGCELEAFASNCSGMRVEVLAVRKGNVIGCSVETGVSGFLNKDKCRPIRTPAQRAEEEAVEAMAALLADDINCTIEDCIAPAERIYRAIRDGKVPGVKLEADQ